MGLSQRLATSGMFALVRIHSNHCCAGCRVRSKTIATSASGARRSLAGQAEGEQPRTAAAARHRLPVAATDPDDDEQHDRLAHGGQELHAREIRQIHARTGVAAQEVQMADRRLRLTRTPTGLSLSRIVFPLPNG